MTAPNAVLLVGITGSDKTLLAQVLAERGLVRLVDEEVNRLQGRYGSLRAPAPDEDSITYTRGPDTVLR